MKFLKSTGITRKIDELGRVVIPKEIRRNLSIRDGESLEIFTNEEAIILKKHSEHYGKRYFIQYRCSRPTQERS